MTTTGLCQLCEASQYKYKCPVCMIKYCSVSCYKSHKTNGCEKPTGTHTAKQDALYSSMAKEDGELSEESGGENEDVVLPEKLQLLGQSTAVKDLLRNPHLRDLMVRLNCSDNVERDIELAMHEPLFLELTEACMNVVETCDPDYVKT